MYQNIFKVAENVAHTSRNMLVCCTASQARHRMQNYEHAPSHHLDSNRCVMSHHHHSLECVAIGCRRCYSDASELHCTTPTSGFVYLTGYFRVEICVAILIGQLWNHFNTGYVPSHRLDSNRCVMSRRHSLDSVEIGCCRCYSDASELTRPPNGQDCASRCSCSSTGRWHSRACFSCCGAP